MSAKDPIGNVTQMILKSEDALGNDYETKIPFVINPAATYEKVDAAARTLNSLSTNAYKDTLLITQVSVNEVLAEE